MAFLRKSDYYTLINSTDLDVITGSDDDLLTQQEKSSKEEVSSYLRHRYDTKTIFKDIKSYADATQFTIDDLVEWSETAYNASSTYNTNDRVSQGGSIYQADEDGITGTFDDTKWTLLATNESLYICRVNSLGNLPSSTNIFSYTANLFTGDHDSITGWDREDDTLYFKRIDAEIRIYTSTADRTNDTDFVGVIQYNIDAINPPYKIEITAGNNTDIQLGGFIDIIGYIDDEQEWSVVASKYWELGDNRNAKLVELMVDVNLYHLYSRISPRNVPDYAINRYDGGTERQTAGAIAYLKMVQKGSLDMDLPRHYKDDSGQRITFRYTPKLNNSY